MDDLIRDVRKTLRALLRERIFSGAVLLTLAICIGANIAVYGVIRKVLLEPLPFDQPDRIVAVYNSYPGAGVPRAGSGSVDFFERRENIDAFEEVAVFQGWGNTVGEAGDAERVSSMRVTPSFFRVLRVEPILGRAFTEDEMVRGNHLKVILTYGYWQEHFAGAPDVVGREMRLGGETFTVVGVLDEDFPTFFGSNDNRFLLALPFSEDARQLDNWHSNNYGMIARLRDGASVEQATAQNQALNDALIERWSMPNARQILTDARYATVVTLLAKDLVRDVQPLLYMLWAGVGLVLLIGCVNVANLMLARAQTHTDEMATELALGASRWRVARRVLTEAVLMGLVGGALGLAVGAPGLSALKRLGAVNLPRGTEIAIQAPDILVTLLLAVGAGVLVGAIPMIQVMRSDLSPVFRAGGRTGTESRRTVVLRNGLVTGQVALAFVLLIGAGLMLVSFRAALAVDPGFRPEGVLTAFVSLPDSRYLVGDARQRFWDEFLPEVRALPGVDAASLTTQLPFSGNNSSSVIFPEGYEPAPGESLLAPQVGVVGPGYFEAMGIDLLEGRTFEEADGPDALRVMIVDEWLANRYWPGRSPVGARMVFGVVPGQDSIPEQNIATVVGVVRTIKHSDLTQPASEHVGAYYFTYRQGQSPGYTGIVVHSATGDGTGATPGMRAILSRLDPGLPLFNVETMEQRIDESLASRRIPLILVSVFAGVALFLAAVGIFGALAHAVAQRTREIGIRMAMGAEPRAIFRTVVREGLVVTAVGLAFGGVASFLLTRLIRSQLFEVGPTDPRVLVAVAAGLATVSFVACVLPAKRATSVDPVQALTGP